MRTQIRRVGNSAGFVIPAILIKEANVDVGTFIDLTFKNGYFLAKPIRRGGGARSTLTLNSLIANYRRLEDEVFINPIGNEVIKDDNNETEHSRRSRSTGAG